MGYSLRWSRESGDSRARRARLGLLFPAGWEREGFQRRVMVFGRFHWTDLEISHLFPLGEIELLRTLFILLFPFDRDTSITRCD